MIYISSLLNYILHETNHFDSQKKVKKKAKKRKPRQNQQQQPEGESEEVLNDKWDEVTSDLSAMLQEREDIPENVVPFDAASEQPVEEQR